MGLAPRPEAPATPQDRALVAFNDVTKRYGQATVLDHISFTIDRGQRLVIIGPSGSGKTTILRCLMTLEPFQGGSIWVDGTELRPASFGRHLGQRQDGAVAAVRTKVGIVFQQYNLFPHMRVVDNVAVGPHYVRGNAWPEARAEARTYLEKVGLGDKADAYPGQLSGGQQQRAAIARTLALKPEIVLLDEITSALDPELVGEVLLVVKALAEESGVTLLIVTHEMHFAAEIADRVMFIERGQIVEDGPPGVVFHDPRSERTKQFLRSLSDYR